ncbi:MAG TPA: MBL fold metallo-hydrolase [Thermoanaerobaculia bacterium]
MTDPVAAPLHFEKITEQFYVLRGGGRIIQVAGVDLPTAGTSAVFIRTNDVVLVDTKVGGWGTAIVEKLKEITDKPLTTIINTHTHFDHVGSNPEFPDGVEVIAHENTANLMREMRPVSGGPVQPNIFAEGRGLPTQTFKDRLTIGSGDDRIELHYLGPAHTSGDAWVVFPAASALHSGDAFAHKGVPPLDVNNGANGIEYPRTIAKAVEAFNGLETVVTGHYHETLRIRDLQTYADFTRDFVDAVLSAKRKGMTVDEFVSGWRLRRRYLDEGYVDFSHLRSIKPDVEAIWNQASF